MFLFVERGQTIYLQHCVDRYYSYPAVVRALEWTSEYNRLRFHRGGPGCDGEAPGVINPETHNLLCIFTRIHTGYHHYFRSQNQKTPYDHEFYNGLIFPVSSQIISNFPPFIICSYVMLPFEPPQAGPAYNQWQIDYPRHYSLDVHCCHRLL